MPACDRDIALAKIVNPGKPTSAVMGHSACMELAFIKAEGHELEGAFKTPSLRNVTARAPFGHAGQFSSIEDVLQHYNTAPAAGGGHSELTRLHLTTEELAALAAFLNTLGSQEPTGE